MEDFRKLLPHHKKEVKLDAKGSIQQTVNEICETKSCNTCLFFETRKKKDLYIWAASTPNGPSIKFHVFNIHTMEELKLTGNSLMGSRPVLSFDGPFEELPHLKLIKSTFTTVRVKARVRVWVKVRVKVKMGVEVRDVVKVRVWFRVRP
jgi:ribosome biogenesis protein BRX1